MYASWTANIAHLLCMESVLLEANVCNMQSQTPVLWIPPFCHQHCCSYSEWYLVDNESVSGTDSDRVLSFSPCSCRAASHCLQTCGYKETGCLRSLTESGAFGHVWYSAHHLHISNGQFLTSPQWRWEQRLIMLFSGHWQMLICHICSVFCG